MNLSELVGKTLKERYRITEMLGQGGMGAIFRATDLILDRTLAVKIMLPPEGSPLDLAALARRFAREAKLAASLRDTRHIAQIFDFDWLDGQPYLVMEYIEGKDLSEVMASKPGLPLARKLEIVEQIALALQEGERSGIVHRDIKPKNIRLCDYQPGGKIVVKVLDFGLAKRIDQTASPDEKDTQLTNPGLLMGTPTHIAPEQINPALAWDGPAAMQRASTEAPKQYPPIDGRADLYALGVILYELIANHLPFQGNAQNLLTAHLFKLPPPLPSSVPAKLAALTMRLLAKRPADRVQTASELLAELQRCQAAPAPLGRSLRLLSLLVTGPALGLGLLWLLGRVSSAPAPFSVAPDLSQTPTPPPAPLSVPDLSEPPRGFDVPVPAPLPPAPRPVPPRPKPKIQPQPQPQPPPAPAEAKPPCRGGTGPDDVYFFC